MKKNIFITLTVLATTIVFTNCKKVTSYEPLGDNGQTIVKFYNGYPEKNNDGTLQSAASSLTSIDLISTPQTFEAVTIRRDVSNNAELNKTMTVVIKDDAGAVSTFDPSIIGLPNGQYAPVAPTTLVGRDYQIVFNPGEFSKTIYMTLADATQLNLANTYGLGFRIISVNGAPAKIAGAENVYVLRIGLKNKYDGIYRLNGFILRATDNESTGLVGPKEISLKTTGANSVRYVETHGWANTATIGIAASVGFPTFTVNSDNTVTTSSDGGAFPAGITNFPASSGLISRYDGATKTFYAYSTWGGGIGVREMRDTLVYLRPR